MLEFSVEEGNRPIRNLVYDEIGDKLYIGARNAIISVDAGDLQSDIQVGKTGPLSSDCLSTFDEKCKPEDTRTNVQNDNLVLEVVRSDSNQFLFSCGNGNAGSCEKRDLANISIVDVDYSQTTPKRYIASSSVVNNAARLVNVKKQGNSMNNVLFVAKNYSRSPYGYSAISAWPLTADPLNSIPQFEINVKGPPNFPVSAFQEKYGIDFKAVVESEEFVFFLSVQNNTSKLSKMCKVYAETCGNANCPKTYEDMVIKCSSGTKDFTYVQDAKMVQVVDGRYVLLAVFSDSEELQNPTTRAALCMYTEDTILEGLRQSRRDRFQCNGNDLQKTNVSLSDDDLVFENSKSEVILPQGCINTVDAVSIQKTWVADLASMIIIVNL